MKPPLLDHQSPRERELLDVDTDMIKVFTFDVYALLDPKACFSFVTPYVANKFDILPE